MGWWRRGSVPDQPSRGNGLHELQYIMHHRPTLVVYNVQFLVRSESIQYLVRSVLATCH
jgi:hypothetical protein